MGETLSHSGFGAKALGLRSGLGLSVMVCIARPVINMSRCGPKALATRFSVATVLIGFRYPTMKYCLTSCLTILEMFPVAILLRCFQLPSCSRSGHLAHGNGFDRIKMSDFVVPNRLFRKISCHLAHGNGFDRIKMSDYVVPNRLFTKMSCHLAHGNGFDRIKMSDYVVPNRLFIKISCHLAHGNGFDRIKMSDYVGPNRLFTKISCHLAHGNGFDRIKMSDYVGPNRLFTKMSWQPF